MCKDLQLGISCLDYSSPTAGLKSLYYPRTEVPWSIQECLIWWPRVPIRSQTRLWAIWVSIIQSFEFSLAICHRSLALSVNPAVRCWFAYDWYQLRCFVSTWHVAEIMNSSIVCSWSLCHLIFGETYFLQRSLLHEIARFQLTVCTY